MQEKQFDESNAVIENLKVPYHPFYDEDGTKHISNINEIETSNDYLTWLVEQNYND